MLTAMTTQTAQPQTAATLVEYQAREDRIRDLAIAAYDPADGGWHDRYARR